jgi:hypothetical protein
MDRRSGRLGCRYILRNRQRDVKTGSAARIVVNPDIAFMGNNDGSGDGKANPCSGLFGGKEVLENTIPQIGIDPGSTIRNGDFNSVSTVTA